MYVCMYACMYVCVHVCIVHSLFEPQVAVRIADSERQIEQQLFGSDGGGYGIEPGVHMMLQQGQRDRAVRPQHRRGRFRRIPYIVTVLLQSLEDNRFR